MINALQDLYSGSLRPRHTRFSNTLRELCKSESIIYKYRIPQLKSRTNYNILGFYEGEDISIMDKYYEDFFNKISS